MATQLLNALELNAIACLSLALAMLIANTACHSASNRSRYSMNGVIVSLVIREIAPNTTIAHAPGLVGIFVVLGC